MLRSLLAIAAGILVWGLLWTASNGTLARCLPDFFRADGTTQHTGILLSVLGVSILCSLLAGYLTATLAPRRPAAHTAVLALIQLGIGVAVQWSTFQSLPLWYNLVFLALVVPGHWFGGQLSWSRQVSVQGAR